MDDISPTLCSKLPTPRSFCAKDGAPGYDTLGNLVSSTDRKNQVTSLSYDPLNRLTFVGYGTTVNAGVTLYESTTAYTYDGGNRLTQADDSAGGTIVEAYDNLNRLTSETTPQGVVSYSYDAAGRRASMTVAGQPQVSYSYDDANRLTQIAQGTTTVGFGYDEINRRTSLALSNGVNIAYAYDNDSRVTGISYNFGANTLGDLSYSYDELGRRTQVGGAFAQTGFPSPVSSASYDAANELTNWNGTAISYDLNGNMLSDGFNAFTWNARNQVASLNGANLQYDAFGRRTLNAAGTSFLYDGANAAQELSGSTVSANLLTGGIDEVFARSDSLGSFTPLQDALGSTVALVDVNGNVATQYSYDPFGNTTVAGVLSSNPAQYTGRENERNGLYFHRARYYNPVIGRFISEDPIGFAGGQENLYAYVFNNPTGFVDPYGLDAWDRLQNFSDFSNGAASVLTFGVTDQINNALGNSQFVNQCSGWHALGTVTGIGLTTAIGGAAGAEAAEANAAEDGYEFSHWIPNRYGGPRSIFNGNYVSEEFHYLTDPFRYPSGWQQFGSKLPAAAQQLLRIPWVYVGGGAGAAYGGTSAMHGRNCGCSK